MIVISDTNIIYSCFYKPDDYPFIALHLQKGHKIWTCDLRLIKGLIEEGLDICITTKDLKERTYKKTNN